ncbi:DUF5675 family protein [Chondrinema litorale]|uniref:DUF5675 family protein n=1 Tax=Chondrinema litorale TaxID=2994555 RepID=UPI00254326D6|nr:DUF5675 family protein [Chondrinema litorale]UZR93126.1 DUF5675 family protein [Chondrinema litorale]
MRALLIRLSDNGKQTVGEFRIYNQHQLLLSCFTLELPYKNNENKVSCIPKGTYQVQKRKDPASKFNYEHLHILNVVNRDWILMHVGNYNYQIQGCILPGDSLYDINQDGQLDVTNSRKTLEKILKIVSETFILEIV